MNSRAKIGEWPLALVHFSFMRPLDGDGHFAVCF